MLPLSRTSLHLSPTALSLDLLKQKTNMVRRLSSRLGAPCRPTSAEAPAQSIEIEVVLDDDDDDDDEDEAGEGEDDAMEEVAEATTAAAPRAFASAFASALEEATCGICLDPVAAAYAVGGCGHVFCGGCLARSVKVSLAAATAAPAAAAVPAPCCPQCRAPISAAPTRVRMLDNILAGLAAADEAGNTVSERLAAFDESGGVCADCGGVGDDGNGDDSRALDAAAAARIFAALSSPSRVRRQQGAYGARFSFSSNIDASAAGVSDASEEEDEGAEDDPPLDANPFAPRFNLEHAAEAARARAATHLQEIRDRESAALLRVIQRVQDPGARLF